MVPYWVFPLETGAHIERHVPALPLSRDASQLEALKRSLGSHRMVFGQPRQDDLMAFLLDRRRSELLERSGRCGGFNRPLEATDQAWIDERAHRRDGALGTQAPGLVGSSLLTRLLPTSLSPQPCGRGSYCGGPIRHAFVRAQRASKSWMRETSSSSALTKKKVRLLHRRQ